VLAAAGREAVSNLITLLDRPQDLYRAASDSTRRVLNEAFFTRVCLDWQDGADAPRVSGDQVTDYLSPFVEVHRARTGAITTNGAAPKDNAASVTSATLLAAALDGQCSHKVAMVDLRGFEPLTPSMRTRCATGLRHRPILLRGCSWASAMWMRLSQRRGGAETD
jgi:site-specific DNA recombinase